MLKKPPPQRSVDELYDDLIKSLRGDDPDLMSLCIRKLNIEATAFRLEGDDLLSLAIQNNCRYCIAPLVGFGFDLNRSNPKTHKHPLEEAIDANSMVVLECLLKNGANPNSLHTRYGTIIHAAAATRMLDSLIPCLVSRGGDANAVAPDGRFPLHLAVSNVHVLNVEQLLERGANINAQDMSGRSALHIAVQLDQFDPIAYILLDYGADPVLPDNGGVTPAQLAEIRKEPKLTSTFKDRADWHKQLSDHPAMSMQRPFKADAFREELLQAVITGNRRTVLELFLSRGGDNWKPTSQVKESPLLLALSKRRFDIAALFFAFRRGVEDRDQNFRNAVHYVMCGSTNPIILLAFLKTCFKIRPRMLSEPDKNGQTPLQASLAEGVSHDPEVAEKLLNEASQIEPPKTAPTVPVP